MKINKSFLKKFARFLSLGLVCLMLFYVAQIDTRNSLLEKGPVAVLADEEDFGEVGPANVSEPWFEEPIFEPAPAPVFQPAPQPAAPSCTGTPREYNECISCNTSRHVTQNACGVYNITVPSQHDDACSSWCSAPAQPAAPSCTPNDRVNTKEECVGNQMCTRNEWLGSSCNTGFGDPYNCRLVPGQCGYNPAPAPQAPAPYVPAPQPAAPFTPAVPAGAPLPQCNTLANNTVCGQKAYDTCHEYTQGGVKYYNCTASQNANCTGIIQCSAPAAPVTPPAQTQTSDQRAQCPSGTTAITSTNNVITCINVNAQQQVSQTQTVVAQGGNAVINIPGGIVSRTEIIREQPVAVQVARVDCPAGTVKKVVDREVICEVTGRPIATVAGAKELPKTGLPALAWAAGALIPLGMKLRGFRKFSTGLISSPNYIWEDRQFKR